MGAGFRFPVPLHGKHLEPLLELPVPPHAIHSPCTPLGPGGREDNGLVFFFVFDLVVDFFTMNWQTPWCFDT